MKESSILSLQNSTLIGVSYSYEVSFFNSSNRLCDFQKVGVAKFPGTRDLCTPLHITLIMMLYVHSSALFEITFNFLII